MGKIYKLLITAKNKQVGRLLCKAGKHKGGDYIARIYKNHIPAGCAIYKRCKNCGISFDVRYADIEKTIN